MYTALGVIFVLLCLPVIRWVVKAVSSNMNTVIDAPPEFEVSKFSGLYVAYSQDPEAHVVTDEERKRLHQLHSENCCTLYDQEKDK
jgi:hypothetical protein